MITSDRQYRAASRRTPSARRATSRGTSFGASTSPPSCRPASNCTKHSPAQSRSQHRKAPTSTTSFSRCRVLANRGSAAHPCSDVVVPTPLLRSAIQKAYRNCMLSERVLAAGNFAPGPHWQSRLLAGASSQDAERDAPDQSRVHLILSNEGVGRL